LCGGSDEDSGDEFTPKRANLSNLEDEQVSTMYMYVYMYIFSVYIHVIHCICMHVIHLVTVTCTACVVFMFLPFATIVLTQLIRLILFLDTSC
jgi:hypothetical protein